MSGGGSVESRRVSVAELCGVELVEDPDALCDEYQRRGVECSPAGIQTTAWGTREFALWDPDRNALTFYRNVPKEDG